MEKSNFVYCESEDCFINVSMAYKIEVKTFDTDVERYKDGYLRAHCIDGKHYDFNLCDESTHEALNEILLEDLRNLVNIVDDNK